MLAVKAMITLFETANRYSVEAGLTPIQDACPGMQELLKQLYAAGNDGTVELATGAMLLVQHFEEDHSEYGPHFEAATKDPAVKAIEDQLDAFLRDHS